MPRNLARQGHELALQLMSRAVSAVIIICACAESFLCRQLLARASVSHACPSWRAASVCPAYRCRTLTQWPFPPVTAFWAAQRSQPCAASRSGPPGHVAVRCGPGTRVVPFLPETPAMGVTEIETSRTASKQELGVVSRDDLSL